ncbi:MAG: hypothetical protein A7315_02000 [Candidatus Altiarchaeales archaeon WOR_SM1_79]|nr:MAG: hypothetical protein A7315_02000 [Candidatus Altiarchaeales archaeon WOR_SM1_79]
MKTKTTISMALFFALLICTVNVSATWWDNSWEYKKEVTITEQSGSDLTNYQIKIELNTTPLYDGGKLQSQCQDVRFINGSENAELDFWIEECITNNNSKNSIFWVEVPSITASSTETRMD